MKTHALMVILLGAIALLVAGFAPPGSTAGQPQPTMVLSPSSGPCDATVQVTGTGFVDEPSLRLYVVRPGTADISVSLLNSAFIIRDGGFSEAVGLYNGGCDAAALDSQSDHPTGHLVIAGSFTFEGDVKPGERIPNIIAVAEYGYTTTVAQPAPTLVLSPSSGPCDAMVEITGHDFPPNTAIFLFMGTPKSDGTLGKLASLVTDPVGGFVTKVILGSLGCKAAGLDDHYSGQLSIGADFENPAVNGENILTRTDYTYTTTTLSPAPQALPSTGSGPGQRSTSPVWLELAGALAAAGLVLVVGLLYRSRRLRS